MTFSEIPSQEPSPSSGRQILSGVGKGVQLIFWAVFLPMNAMMCFWGPLYYPAFWVFVFLDDETWRKQMIGLCGFYALTGGALGLCVNRKSGYHGFVRILMGAVLGPFWVLVLRFSKPGSSFRMKK